jgi:flagellar biosynthesis/type III secretory pathway protein FliH
VKEKEAVNKAQLRQLDHLITSIDKTREGIKRNIAKTLHDIVVQQIKTDQTMYVSNIMEDLENASTKMIHRSFLYKYKEEID